MANLKEATFFLLNTWRKQCRTGDYVFICIRDPKGKEPWTDIPIQYSRKGIKEEIDRIFASYPPEDYDVYFCPLPFSEPRRSKKLVTRTKLLWQDLDYADPQHFDHRVEPTTYWESSPGRYHGLWELDKLYSGSDNLKKIGDLNKDLAYYVDADKGGWDFTQVLRIPGTHNHKYEDKPLIEYVKRDLPPVKMQDYRKIIPVSTRTVDPSQEDIEFKELDHQEVFNKWASKLPKAVLKTLMAKSTFGQDRSETLWNLENQLFECGLSTDEIYTLAKHSVWNKFKGRHDEDDRLENELLKVIEHQRQNGMQVTIEVGDDGTAQASSSDPEIDREQGNEEFSFLVETFADVMGTLDANPGWLVEGFWAKRSHGIVAGEPKSFKTTYVMDLAISVASGVPFLGKYEVDDPGPVIYVQNENATWILQDRMGKMIASKGIGGHATFNADDPQSIDVELPQDMPLYFINQQGFQLDHPLHQEIFEEFVEKVKPVLVIFDPLYLMFDGDINSAKDLNPVLNWMLKLKNDYKTGVIAVHHYNKGAGGGTWRGGQRMLGSTTLHGWIESAWYLNRREEDQPDHVEGEELDKQSKQPSKVILDREFRNAGHYPKLELSLLMGGLGEPEYEVEVNPYTEDDDSPEAKRKARSPEEIQDELLEYLTNLPTPGASVKSLAEFSGVSYKVMIEALKILVLSNPGKFVLRKNYVQKLEVQI